jgi:hypothetical protein
VRIPLGTTLGRRLMWAKVSHASRPIHDAEVLACDETPVAAAGLRRRWVPPAGGGRAGARPVHVTPGARDLDIVRIDEPLQTHRMPARSRRVDRQCRKAMYPSKQGHAIDVDTALCEELFEVSIRPETEIPPHPRPTAAIRQRNRAYGTHTCSNLLE